MRRSSAYIAPFRCFAAKNWRDAQRTVPVTAAVLDSARMHVCACVRACTAETLSVWLTQMCDVRASMCDFVAVKWSAKVQCSRESSGDDQKLYLSGYGHAISCYCKLQALFRVFWA